MPKKAKLPGGSIGHIVRGPFPDDGLIPRTIEFIRSLLPVWRDDPKRPPITSEKSLNSTLCDFLDHRARTQHAMVRFKHEAPQYSSRTVDIGIHGTEDETIIDTCIYTFYDPFMVVEAKRLPSPKKAREREYVSGMSEKNGTPTGGIQRFKLGLHGAKVSTVAMVGYIEADTVEHWHQTINQWIADLVGKTNSDGSKWHQSEILGLLDFDGKNGTSSTESNHQRTGDCLTSTIKISHLWVVMRPETE